MRGLIVLFLAVLTQVAPTRVAVERPDFAKEATEFKTVVATNDAESFVETDESTDAASRRRAAPAHHGPAPHAPAHHRPAPHAPAHSSYDSRRRAAPANPAPSYDARRRAPAPPVPSHDVRRRGSPAPADSRRRAPAPVPSHDSRRRAPAPPVHDIRRRDSSRRRMNYNSELEDATRRRSDLRRRSGTGWVEGSHRRRGVFPAAAEMSVLGFAGGLALGYAVASADNVQYYYHDIGWSDMYGVYHNPGYYSPSGYYWASGDEIGFSTKFGRWSTMDSEITQLFGYLDLNADGVLNYQEFLGGLERELIEFGPAGNALVPR